MDPDAMNDWRTRQHLFSDMYPAALRVFRAFSAKRLFYHEPRARGLTLGFSLASASRLCAGVKPGRAGDDHLTTDHGARGRAPSRVGARPVTPAPSTVVVRPSLQLLT
jgi:hypothetical protein